MMVRSNNVTSQLKRIGVSFRFWGRSAVQELPGILFDNEILEHLVLGRYQGGWALLVATNCRVLLIDKKPFYLTIEDMRYDMIADVEFDSRLIDTTLRLGTVNKTLSFTAYNQTRLRSMTTYIQQQVMDFRQRHVIQQPTYQEPGYNPQFQNVITDQVIGQSAIKGLLSQPPIHPYNSPVVIRRRVSRFY